MGKVIGPAKKIGVLRAVNRLEIPAAFDVEADKAYVDRSTWIMYETLPYFASKIKEGIVPANPDREFYTITTDLVNAYIFEEIEPPAEIAISIKNIADDHLNGRVPVIRAGDYIAIQNYARSRKKIEK